MLDKGCGNWGAKIGKKEKPFYIFCVHGNENFFHKTTLFDFLFIFSGFDGNLFSVYFLCIFFKYLFFYLQFWCPGKLFGCEANCNRLLYWRIFLGMQSWTLTTSTGIEPRKIKWKFNWKIWHGLRVGYWDVVGGIKCLVLCLQLVFKRRNHEKGIFHENDTFETVFIFKDVFFLQIDYSFIRSFHFPFAHIFYEIKKLIWNSTPTLARYKSVVLWNNSLKSWFHHFNSWEILKSLWKSVITLLLKRSFLLMES